MLKTNGCGLRRHDVQLRFTDVSGVIITQRYKSLTENGYNLLHN